MRLALATLLVTASLHAANFGPQGGFDLDATAARAMQTYDVPGLAVAIVKDGKVVAAKGYGVRKLGTPGAVDADTLFSIASNTKAFTTTALAILAGEGKLDWDDRVVKYLPGFAMSDPWATREMTIRDLVTHRSGLGLGEGDLLWWPQTDYSRDEIVGRLRFLKPVTTFRSRYAYENVLYLVAGQVVAAASGKSWDEFVRDRILGPLAMTSTRTSISMVPSNAPVASPHVPVDGHLRAIAPLAVDNMAPCCGIVSTANDMARWMLAQLDGRLVSEAEARELWTPQTVTPPEPGALLQAYALGWSIRDYRGHRIVTHNGGLLGGTSQVLLVPEAKLGITVLANQDDRAAVDATVWSIVDAYLGVPPADWMKTFKPAERIVSAAPNGSKPEHPLATYAGRYLDAWYGQATVTLERDRLVLHFAHTPLLTGDLDPVAPGRFLVRWRDRSLNADAYASFTGDGHLRLEAVSPATDFSFDFQDLDFVRAAADAPR